MKRRKLRAITPTWAQRIQVERHGDELVIAGCGHISSPFSARAVPSEQQSKLDILQRLRRYTLRHLGKSDGTGGVYQFADAIDDEKLVSFCGAFGPVWGKVQSEVFENGTGASTITVLQSIRRLRAEQKKFLAAIELCAELNKNGRADYTVIAEKMAQLGIDRESLSLVHVDILDRHKGQKIEEYLDLGHWVFCMIMNDHPPKLVPIEGEAIELPNVCGEGILSALYYQLRLDYLAQRTIGSCLHCGNHFSVFKRGARACGAACGRALRNNKYWTKRKRAINRKRRDKRREEE